MDGQEWLTYFAESITFERKKYLRDISLDDSEWTDFMYRVMDAIADKMGCIITHRRPNDKARSGEYLNIDAFFVDKEAFKVKLDDYDPFVLPMAIVELENDYDTNKIAYCLWKLLCIRSTIRVLICYQNELDKIESLRKHLEEVVRDGYLMKGDNGDLLVIIGNESITIKNWESYFSEYFSVYIWKNDRFEITPRRASP